MRIYFRLSAEGQAWIKEVALTETRPTPPRWVKVACTNGTPDLRSAEAVLEAAGKAKVDLVLLPEWVQGNLIPEPLGGPSCRLMAAMAKSTACTWPAASCARPGRKTGFTIRR